MACIYGYLTKTIDNERKLELEGSIALNKISDRIESLRIEYDTSCKKIPKYAQWFVWARLVVIIRIFGLVINEVKTDGLIAMADMLNHKHPRETKWTYDEKKEVFVITSPQAIEKDCEIFASYGCKCNSRFFVNYEFSLEHNLDNEAIMSFELSSSDQLILKDVCDIVYALYCDLNIFCECGFNKNFYNNGYYYPTTEPHGMLCFVICFFYMICFVLRRELLVYVFFDMV